MNSSSGMVCSKLYGPTAVLLSTTEQKALCVSRCNRIFATLDFYPNKRKPLRDTDGGLSFLTKVVDLHLFGQKIELTRQTISGGPAVGVTTLSPRYTFVWHCPSTSRSQEKHQHSLPLSGTGFIWKPTQFQEKNENACSIVSHLAAPTAGCRTSRAKRCILWHAWWQFCLVGDKNMTESEECSKWCRTSRNATKMQKK